MFVCLFVRSFVRSFARNPHNITLLYDTMREYILLCILGLALTVLNNFEETMETKGFFFQFEIIINVLVIALSDSFEYLCYGSTVIRNMSTLTVR